MSDTAQDIAPAVDPQAPPQEPQEPVTPPEPVTDGTEDLEPELAQQVIDIPEGEKLVPLSALTATRRELKALKGQSSRAAELEQELAALKGQVSQQNPVLQAAQALLMAQQAGQRQQQAQQPQGPDPEYLAELDATARDLDLYKPDGTPDLEKAHRIVQRNIATARAAAQHATQPMVAKTLQSEADYMIERAKVTKGPQGEQPDPAILEDTINRIKAQPHGLDMLARPEYMLELWQAALGKSIAQGKVKIAGRATAVAEPPPPPVFTEKSGGLASPSYSLNSGDKKLAKDMGMSDAEFAKAAAAMPWGKR